jgi:hypothetical protein
MIAVAECGGTEAGGLVLSGRSRAKRKFCGRWVLGARWSRVQFSLANQASGGPCTSRASTPPSWNAATLNTVVLFSKSITWAILLFRIKLEWSLEVTALCKRQPNRGIYPAEPPKTQQPNAMPETAEAEQQTKTPCDAAQQVVKLIKTQKVVIQKVIMSLTPPPPRPHIFISGRF